jgi:hypothetical protein
MDNEKNLGKLVFVSAMVLVQIEFAFHLSQINHVLI